MHEVNAALLMRFSHAEVKVLGKLIAITLRDTERSRELHEVRAPPSMGLPLTWNEKWSVSSPCRLPRDAFIAVSLATSDGSG
jgi:hypothetical protein